MGVRLLALVIGWLALAGLVQAEPFVDVYGGWSKAGDTDVSASQKTCFVVGCTATAQTTQPLTFTSGAVVGARGGYWFDRLSWFGLAGDLSYYRTPATQVQIGSSALAATPMLRLPLWTNPDRPHGYLQPYVGAGPTLIFHHVSANFQPASTISMSGWSVAVGWTARVGLAVPLSDHLAIFSEWRFSQDQVSLRQTGFFGMGDQGRLDLIQTTQQYLFGLSYRF